MRGAGEVDGVARNAGDCVNFGRFFARVSGGADRRGQRAAGRCSGCTSGAGGILHYKDEAAGIVAMDGVEGSVQAIFVTGHCVDVDVVGHQAMGPDRNCVCKKIDVE